MSAVGIYNANNYPDRTFDDSLEPVIFPGSQRLCNCHLSDNEWPVIMAEGVQPPYKYNTYLFCQSTSKTNPAEGRKLLKRMMNSRMSGRYILLEFQRLRGSRCVCVILYQITKLVMSSQISLEFQPLPEKLWFRVDVEYGASTSILLEGIIGTLKCCILYTNPSPGFVLVPELLIVTHSEIMSEIWKEENSLADFWSKISPRLFPRYQQISSRATKSLTRSSLPKA